MLSLLAWMVLTQVPQVPPFHNVYDESSLSNNRPCSQSSYWRPPDTPFVGNETFALDGKLPVANNAVWYCIHTTTEDNPWWEVDLGRRTNIANVTIVGRTRQTDQSDNLQVLIKDCAHCPERTCGGDDAIYHTAGRAGNTYNSHHTESTVDVPCDVAGRYIRIRARDRGQLVLCEVFVSEGLEYTGTDSPTPVSTTMSPTLPYHVLNFNNVAQGRQSVTQSSIWRNNQFGPGAAVDGRVPNQRNSVNWCIHTNRGPMNWWQVDLGQQYFVTNVTIVGRTHQTNQGDNLKVLIKTCDQCQSTACGGDSAVWHTAGQPGNQRTTHYNDSMVDVPCQQQGQIVRIVSMDNSELVLCEVIVQAATMHPTSAPTTGPITQPPTATPSPNPSEYPTAVPSRAPASSSPSMFPIMLPSKTPSVAPGSSIPSTEPSLSPQSLPSRRPSESMKTSTTVLSTRQKNTPEESSAVDSESTSTLTIVVVSVVIVLLIVIAVATIVVWRSKQGNNSANTRVDSFDNPMYDSFPQDNTMIDEVRANEPVSIANSGYMDVAAVPVGFDDDDDGEDV